MNLKGKQEAKKLSISDWMEGKTLPLEKFVPSTAAVKFWQAMFPKMEEIGVLDYVEAIVPLFERDIGRIFNLNQLKNLVDTIDFEGRHVINKYESMFFIDRIWNNLEIQGSIWNDRFKSMEDIMKEFKAGRDAMRNTKLKENSGKMADILPQDMFKPYSLKEYLPPYKYEKVPHNRKLSFTFETIKVPEGNEFSSFSSDLKKGTKITQLGEDVLLDQRIVSQKSRSKYAATIEDYSRVLFGEESSCDIKFSLDDVHMASFHFSFEKFGNTLYAHDTSRHARLKFRVMKKPYVLDEGMVVELGNNKAVITNVFPKATKMRRCEESYGFLTRDCSFPYLQVFNGEVDLIHLEKKSR